MLSLRRTHCGKNVKDSACVAAIDSGLVSPVGDLDGIPPQLVQGPGQDLGLIMEMLARGRQRDTVGGARKQVRPHPRFKRADPAAERWLGDMAQLRRPGKIQGFGESQIVLEPDQFHR